MNKGFIIAILILSTCYLGESLTYATENYYFDTVGCNLNIPTFAYVTQVDNCLANADFEYDLHPYFIIESSILYNSSISLIERYCNDSNCAICKSDESYLLTTSCESFYDGEENYSQSGSLSNSFDTEGIFSFAYYGPDSTCQPDSLNYVASYGPSEFVDNFICFSGNLWNCSGIHAYHYVCQDDNCTTCEYDSTYDRGECAYDGESSSYVQYSCGPISSTTGSTGSSASTSSSAITSSSTSHATTSDSPICKLLSIEVLLLISLIFF